eukprot:3939231-Rhodomonas_salina.1
MVLPGAGVPRQVTIPISLWLCYATCGTDMVYGATSGQCAKGREGPVCGRCMPGTSTCTRFPLSSMYTLCRCSRY